MVRPPQLPRPDPGKSRPTRWSPWQQNRRGLEFLVPPDEVHDPPLHGGERGRSGEVPEDGELVEEAREIPNKRGDFPLVSDLAYTNKYFKSGLSLWMAQLRVRYCTEPLSVFLIKAKKIF